MSANTSAGRLSVDCRPFCRCPLSNRGDRFANLRNVKGTGLFLKPQTHYAISRFIINIINIKLVARRSLGNLAKSMFSAFTTDDGFKFSINLLAESSSSGCNSTGKKHMVFKWGPHDAMKPLKQCGTY